MDQEGRYYAQRLAFSRALALAGMTITLSIPVAFYARASQPDTAEVPLVDPSGRGFYLACLLVLGIVAAIIQALDRDDPARLVNRYGERLYRYRMPAPRTAWMLPVVGIGSLYLLAAIHPRLGVVLIVPFLAGGLMLAARMVRFEVLNRPDGQPGVVGMLAQLLTYGAAFGSLLAIFAYRSRTLYTGPLLFLVTMLLLLTLFDGVVAPGWRRLILASAGGLAVAQVGWALGYWNVSTLVGSTMLFLVFAFFGSVSRSHLLGSLSREQVAISAGITAPVFLALAYSVE
jgi:hypothetical protein